MTVSNIYAEKIFAEHPIDLWVLDDQADYVSLITESQRQIWTAPGWILENCTASAGTDVDKEEPFDTSYVSKIIGDADSSPETYDIVIKSPEMPNMSTLNQSIGTVTISSYVYSKIIDAYFEDMYIGIEYTLPGNTSATVVEKKINFLNIPEWVLIGETFDIVNENIPFRFFIKLKVNTAGNAGDYNFYVNGLTLGQWSSEFNSTSLGVVPTSIPSTIALPSGLTGTVANAYGLSSDNGYYLVNNKYFTAKNTSIPLVFGASNLTIISPNKSGSTTLPSLIVPGKGFLNEAGRNQEYTVEFWMRVNCDASIPKKIFGPISGNDGLYAEDGFLTLVVGGQSQSYFVNEWYRPMLVDIRLIRNSVSMLINGEEVINFSINTDTMVLPDILNQDTSSALYGKNQDWLGFYSYDDIFPFEISCISVYSYQVPIAVIKRRFVYGQGVGSPENINSTFGGTTAFIDYAFANYAVNYNYPDFARWDQGTFDNLVTSNKFLSIPEYELPEIVIPGKTLNQLYADNSATGVQNETYKFITFRPNSSWDNKHTYFNFPKFNILNDEVHTFYGVFKPSTTFLDNQVLIKFNNKITGNYLSIEVDKHDINNDGVEENVIAYYLVYNGQVQNDFIMYEYTPGNRIAVGINIQKFAEYYGGNVAAFFGNQNGIEVYVGGDPINSAKSFTGKIYDIDFCSERNAADISDHFNENGIAKVADANQLIDHLASYSLLVGQNYGEYNLDIGVSAYWEDYLPLSYFAKFVKDYAGDTYYDLDFLQFNIGYPAISSLTETEINSGWTYAQLSAAYSSPVTKSYLQLSNIALTGYDDYQELAFNTQSQFDYNTENASVKSYLTFQNIIDGANLTNDNFTTTQNADQSKLINLSAYTNWRTTRFEVVDNTIIYPRKDFDFNDLAVVLNLEFKVRSTIGKTVTIDRVQFASQVFSQNASTPVGTRFGVNLFPYTKSGIYFDYKSQNPFSIYKGSTPYLYLTRTSGIEMRGDVTQKERGLSIPINQQLAPDYDVNALQVWMRYDGTNFPTETIKLFSIEYKNEDIVFYLEPSDTLRRRGRIYALRSNSSEQFLDLAYYINGRPVAVPTITAKEWTALGVFFLTPLDLENFAGKVNLLGPFVFNNISFYRTNSLANVQNIVTRSWASVETTANPNYPTPAEENGGTDDEGWRYWKANPARGVNWGSWFNVLALDTYQTTDFDPGTIYKAYIGTNKIVFDDDEGINLNSEKINTYSDIKWLRRTESAV